MRWFLAIFFRELYTRLAWMYDLVALITSVGEWFTWQRTAYEALPGDPVLEIGCGTGHTQLDLASRGWQTTGVDISPQMAHITRRRLLDRKLEPMVVRADARALPFPSAAFVSALSTFPSEYLFEIRYPTRSPPGPAVRRPAGGRPHGPNHGQAARRSARRLALPLHGAIRAHLGHLGRRFRGRRLQGTS